MKIAYADPPYLGSARKHYGRLHAEAQQFDGVTAHRDLIARLADHFPDGWALSCASTNLQTLLPLCPTDVRVAAWVKPFASFKPGVNPGYCWEPVIWRGGRMRRDRTEATVRDWHSANITLRRGMPGAKPTSFCCWLFALLGLEKGDELIDLFPGSGAVASAWEQWTAETTPPLAVK